MKIKELHISGRRWFQKSSGNTYHSVTVCVNNDVLRCDCAYGYDDQFLQTAWELLQQAGYDVGKYGGTRKLREELGGTYDVCDVPRKRDL